MNFLFSHIVRAFDANCVGTKVIDPDGFLADLSEAVSRFEFPPNGQGVVPMTRIETVSCGVTSRTGLKPEDYVIREWRGAVSLFAKRVPHDRPAEHLAAVVYTHAAYLGDPEITPGEIERVETATHVLVAVLGSRGTKPPVGFGRFVRNLAGANARYAPANGYTLHSAIQEAQEIVACEDSWITVAD